MLREWLRQISWPFISSDKSHRAFLLKAKVSLQRFIILLSCKYHPSLVLNLVLVDLEFFAGLVQIQANEHPRVCFNFTYIESGQYFANLMCYESGR